LFFFVLISAGFSVMLFCACDLSPFHCVLSWHWIYLVWRWYK